MVKFTFFIVFSRLSFWSPLFSITKIKPSYVLRFGILCLKRKKIVKKTMFTVAKEKCGSVNERRTIPIYTTWWQKKTQTTRKVSSKKCGLRKQMTMEKSLFTFGCWAASDTLSLFSEPRAEPKNQPNNTYYSDRCSLHFVHCIFTHFNDPYVWISHVAASKSAWKWLLLNPTEPSAHQFTSHTIPTNY